MTRTRVIHVQEVQDLDGLFCVYISRPTKWGNPFVIGRDGSREEVIAKYREWLSLPAQEQLRLAAKKELHGKALACWCAPLPCHGDVLKEVADA